MISRNATQKIKQLATLFKAIAITGPRQSGKTTLVKAIFGVMAFCSLFSFQLY